MSIKKIICLLFSMIVVFASLSGCTSKSDKIEVTIWYSSDDQEATAMNDIVDRFNAQSNNIVVKAINQPSSGFTDSIYNAVANGIGPDIIFNYATMAADFIPTNQVVDLGEYIDKEWLKNNVPAGIYNESVSFEDGKLHCLPLHTSGPVFYYNKTLFDEYQLTAPETWDQVIDCCELIKEKTGRPAFIADSLVDLMQCRLIQDGSGYIDTENNRVLINNEIAKNAYLWLADNVDNGNITIETVGNRAYEDFAAGIVPMYLGGCGKIEAMKDAKFEIDVIPCPQGANKWVPVWNRSLIVFKSNTDREKAACEFIKFFVDPENSAKWCVASGNLSPYFDTIKHSEYSEYVANNIALTALNESFEYAGFLPAVIGSSTVRTELEKIALQVISKEKTIDEALNDAEEKCNDALRGR